MTIKPSSLLERKWVGSRRSGSAFGPRPNAGRDQRVDAPGFARNSLQVLLPVDLPKRNEKGSITNHDGWTDRRTTVVRTEKLNRTWPPLGGARPPGQRTNTNTNASGTVNVNVYGPGFGLSQNFKYVPSSAPTTSYRDGQNLEIGVHQEVSIISDVDVDDFRETKDDIELSPTTSAAGYKNPPAVPYAYSPTYEYGGRERMHAYANR
ncbi:hypothetical protein C8F01DRAFT_1092261 [Mycena amicta]|nr:hypothetical protein C8F01DRAFT_1092261 [Mycena amicta]